jgi:L-lactate permease
MQRSSKRRNEPLITAGVIGSVVSALVVLLAAFGLPFTEEQVSAINGFVAVVAPIAVTLVGRHFVYGPETVKRIKREFRGH